MKCFRNDQRVEVVANGHPCAGKRGTVVRKRGQDDGAWIRFDEDLPDDLRSFPKGDDRQNHMMLWPDECEEVKA